MNATTSRFSLQILIALIVLAGANVLIARMAKNSVPRQLIRQIDAHPDATFLASGNSLVAAAFDEEQFHTAWNAAPPPGGENVQPLNIALGATESVEQLLLLRHAFAVDHSANVIVYGFFDLQLTKHLTGGWNDLTGNRAMSYYVEPYFAADVYAPESRLQLIQVGLVSHVPMLVERLTLWSKVEKMRRKMEEIGMPPVKTNEFGRAGDFKAMETDLASFKKSCVDCATDNLDLTPSVALMIEAAKSRNATFVFVEMPMQSQHRKLYYDTPEWKAYEDHIKAISEQKGVLFVNASDWLPDDHFADDLHAGPEGAVDFSKRLAEVLKPMLQDGRGVPPG